MKGQAGTRAVGMGGTIREVMGVMHIDRCLGT